MTVTGNSTGRVKDHRDRMRREQCSRLDLTIGTDVADKLKAIARNRGIPLWQAAEDAIELLAKQANHNERIHA